MLRIINFLVLLDHLGSFIYLLFYSFDFLNKLRSYSVTVLLLIYSVTVAVVQVGWLVCTQK